MSARYQRLMALLVAQITSGERPPGSRMPSARELAVTASPDGTPWGRSTAERAMAALAADGWTSAAPGSGTYVAERLPVPGRSLEERVAAVEARLDKHERGHG